MKTHRRKSSLWLLLLLAFVLHIEGRPRIFEEQGVAVPMRDGVDLMADVRLPSRDGKHPVLVYRTPYGRASAQSAYAIFRKAVERGYAVVIQDVRGRYSSQGEFSPYFQEGRDGHDTIEWAARQPWSTGDVGTFGLSYPGAVQWLAAVERPPHLKAMVPAMTFSTPRNFFYSGGVFDGSWPGWIWNNIAPDIRVRKNLRGPRTSEEARAAWPRLRPGIQSALPLTAAEDLRDVAPWYFEWLRHPPEDPWWDDLDLRDKYDRVTAAVLNFSGWYDEAYGPEGATTNFTGLMRSRRGWPDPKTSLILGPWVHGVPGADSIRAGERAFGPASLLDYDDLVLRWMDRHVRGIESGKREPRVRVFVMEANRWREAEDWPLPGRRDTSWYLSSGTGRTGTLLRSVPSTPRRSRSVFLSDPADPVTDPFPLYSGGHDYSAMAGRDDVRVFDSGPLEEDLEVVGRITAEIYLECDAPDTDLWVKLLDLAPDGKAVNLMSPGLDVQRASYRDYPRRSLLKPGRPYRLELGNLMTGNLFRKGHRIRAQISATFFPDFSRNLHTGEFEGESSRMRKAKIALLHSRSHPSRIILPVLPH